MGRLSPTGAMPMMQNCSAISGLHLLGQAGPARTRSRRGTKPKTKRAQLIALLSRKTGKDISAISDQLGWQPHTTRAALSRLRKAGFEIAREVPKRGGAARYRIIAEPAVEVGQ